MDKEIEKKKKEDWLKFLNVRYGFPKGYDIIDKSKLRKQKVKTILKSVVGSIIILVGILAISGVIFYLGFNDKFVSTIGLACNESFVCNCEKTCSPCENNCDVVCGNMTLIYPNEIIVNLEINETI